MTPLSLGDGSPLWISLRSAGLATLIVAPLGVMVAERLRHWRGRLRSFADLLLLSPLVLPPTVLGFLLLQLLGKRGVLGLPLSWIGVSVVFSWQATVISSAVVSFPLMYRSALAAFDQIDPALGPVASSLGASDQRVLRTILLPLALPGLMAGMSLAFARALGEFGTTLMLAGNIPGRTQTLPLAIYAAVDAGEIGRAWMLTALVLLLNGTALLLLQSLERRSPTPAGETLAPESDRALLIPEPEQSNRLPPSYHLSMEIRRRLGDFELDLQLHSRCRRLGILGASGAGKSQMLRCLAGLEQDFEGRIELNGRVLFDAARGINVPLRERRLGLVVQNYALFPHLTVATNVGYALQHLPRRQRQERVARQLRRIGLVDKARCYPSQLSGGQQQRIALARALASEPELLLLDEPFSAQDSHLRRQLQQQLQELLEVYRVPTLMVTHDLEEAFRLSDDLLVIDQGRVQAHGPCQEVFDAPGSTVVARLSGCKNLSALEPRGGRRVYASAWGLELTLPERPSADVTHLGMRAHHLLLQPWRNGEGPQRDAQGLRWRVRPSAISEGPFAVSVYVVPDHWTGEGWQEQESAGTAARPVLQVEMSRREWQQLSDHPHPWCLELCWEHLMLLREECSPKAFRGRDAPPGECSPGRPSPSIHKHRAP